MNQNGLVHVEVLRTGADSMLSQIIRLVQDAQNNKAPMQELADSISAVFVPIVVGIALFSFGVWLTLTYSGTVPPEWIPEGQDNFVFSLLFMVSVLVIACPCALGLATPTAVMVGTGVGAKNGILIKGGSALEQARNVTAIIFDKTGTLTVGKPTVTDIQFCRDMG